MSNPFDALDEIIEKAKAERRKAIIDMSYMNSEIAIEMAEKYREYIKDNPGYIPMIPLEKYSDIEIYPEVDHIGYSEVYLSRPGDKPLNHIIHWMDGSKQKICANDLCTITLEYDAVFCHNCGCQQPFEEDHQIQKPKF